MNVRCGLMQGGGRFPRLWSWWRCPAWVLVLGLPVDQAEAESRLSYAETRARARTLQAQGAWLPARTLLEALSQTYSEDFELVLRIAWLAFVAGEHARAETWYRRAVALSHGHPEAKLGLAWSLARQRRCAPAQALFHRLQTDPEPADWIRRSAVEGEAQCASKPAESSWRPAASMGWVAHSGHPVKRSAAWVDASLPVVLSNGLHFGGTYRYARSETKAAETDAFIQHELHTHMGYHGASWTAVLRYGLVTDSTQTLGTTHLFGVTGQWHWWGTLTGNASVSLYSDGTIGRAELSWWSPPWGLGNWAASVGPVGSVQWVDGQFLGAGGASVRLGLPGWAVVGGAQLQNEVRPAYLDADFVFSGAERLRGSWWLGVDVHMYDGLRIQAGYRFLRLGHGSASGRLESNAHIATVEGSWGR